MRCGLRYHGDPPAQGHRRDGPRAAGDHHEHGPALPQGDEAAEKHGFHDVQHRAAGRPEVTRASSLSARWVRATQTSFPLCQPSATFLARLGPRRSWRPWVSAGRLAGTDFSEKVNFTIFSETLPRMIFSHVGVPPILFLSRHFFFVARISSS